jgi:hypothetical protein
MPSSNFERDAMNLGKRNIGRMAFVVIGCLWGAIAQATSGTVVGEVTTLIGRASATGSEGGTRQLARGTPVHAGDRLETEAGGHVHIRFIDGGLVSVRPLSRLHIEDYSRADGARQGAIKFNLEHGVVRSVTGSWGEADRERFRLNTPVVAIGIKGTDFVVRANQGKTQAAVVSGAIVMTPLSHCAHTIGACSDQETVQLSAEMAGQMLEFDKQHGNAIPRLVPAADLEARIGHNSLLVAKSGDPDREATPAEKNLANGVENLLSDVFSPGKLLDKEIAKQLPSDAPMVWVQNALGWNIPPNSIAERLGQAEIANRQAVVGNFFQTLYRDESTRTAYAGNTGMASFSLKQGSASFSRPGIAYQPVEISNAVLAVDFNAQRFNTQLDLAGAFGSSRFAASGQISPTGTFQQTGTDHGIAGALSHDTRQAGYQFQQNVAKGQINGLTLWGR